MAAPSSVLQELVTHCSWAGWPLGWQPACPLVLEAQESVAGSISCGPNARPHAEDTATFIQEVMGIVYLNGSSVTGRQFQAPGVQESVTVFVHVILLDIPHPVHFSSELAAWSNSSILSPPPPTRPLSCHHTSVSPDASLGGPGKEEADPCLARTMSPGLSPGR